MSGILIACITYSPDFVTHPAAPRTCLSRNDLRDSLATLSTQYTSVDQLMPVDLSF